MSCHGSSFSDISMKKNHTEIPVSLALITSTPFLCYDARASGRDVLQIYQQGLGTTQSLSLSILMDCGSLQCLSFVAMAV